MHPLQHIHRPHRGLWHGDQDVHRARHRALAHRHRPVPRSVHLRRGRAPSRGARVCRYHRARSHLHDCQLHQPAERDRRDWPVPLLRGAHQAVLRRRGARDEHGLQVPGVRHPVQAGPRRDEDQRVGWIIGELIN